MTDGRDSNGRFESGNQEWRKRKRKGPQRSVDLEALHEVIDQAVSVEAVLAAWERVEGVMLSGGRGWLEFFKLYLDRRYGKPNTYQEIDVTTDGESLNADRLTDDERIERLAALLDAARTRRDRRDPGDDCTPDVVTTTGATD